MYKDVKIGHLHDNSKFISNWLSATPSSKGGRQAQMDIEKRFETILSELHKEKKDLDQKSPR